VKEVEEDNRGNEMIQVRKSMFECRGRKCA